MNEKLAKIIDHTILKPDATEEDVKRVCREARQYGFASVCVYQKFIPLVVKELEGSLVQPIAVIDFPNGAGSPMEKAKEAREAIKLGAKELDMVIDKGAIKKRDYLKVLNGIRGVVEAATPCPVKVIIEAGELDEIEKVAACVLSKVAGAAFVKTSTGFGKGGATVEDVALMKKTVGDDMGVKASGGIKTRKDAEAMVAAGATRIGTSSSIAIVLNS